MQIVAFRVRQVHLLLSDPDGHVVELGLEHLGRGCQMAGTPAALEDEAIEGTGLRCVDLFQFGGCPKEDYVCFDTLLRQTEGSCDTLRVEFCTHMVG